MLDSVKQNESSDSDLNDTIQNAHETSFVTAGSDNDDDSVRQGPQTQSTPIS